MSELQSPPGYLTSWANMGPWGSLPKSTRKLGFRDRPPVTLLTSSMYIWQPSLRYKETPSHFHGKHKFLVVDLKVELGLHNLIRQSLVIFCKTYFYIMQITGHMQSCTRIFIMLTICYVSFQSSQSKNAECHFSQFIHDSDSECLLG